jgi:uncharacterized membrane protein
VALLHVPWNAALPGGVAWFVLFALVPWIGVAALGYASGPLFALEPARRPRCYLATAVVLVLLYLPCRWVA